VPARIWKSWRDPRKSRMSGLGQPSLPSRHFWAVVITFGKHTTLWVTPRPSASSSEAHSRTAGINHAVEGGSGLARYRRRLAPETGRGRQRHKVCSDFTHQRCRNRFSLVTCDHQEPSGCDEAIQRRFPRVMDQ
jgi:hypothetical protein